MQRYERWTAAKLALGYLASIVLVVGVLVWGVPRIVGRLPNVVLGIGALALLMPAVGVAALVLQGRLDARPWSVWRAYLLDLVALLFELLFLVLIIPVISLQVIMVMGGLFGAALLIGLIAFAVQELLNLNLGVVIAWADAILYAKILMGVILGEGLLYGLFALLKGAGDNVVDAFVDLNQSVLERLRPHAQTDLKGWRKRKR